MPDGFASALRRLVFWEFPRASWQYDIAVGIILAFIFLTPRTWFRDQPREDSVVALPAEEGARVFWIEPDSLLGLNEAERPARAADLVRTRTGKKQELIRLEPIFDAENEVRGYLAFTRP
jgi:hypothetical protein